jgi:hypothetical protein
MHNNIFHSRQVKNRTTTTLHCIVFLKMEWAASQKSRDRAVASQNAQRRIDWRMHEMILTKLLPTKRMAIRFMAFGLTAGRKNGQGKTETLYSDPQRKRGHAPA